MNTQSNETQGRVWTEDEALFLRVTVNPIGKKDTVNRKTLWDPFRLSFVKRSLGIVDFVQVIEEVARYNKAVEAGKEPNVYNGNLLTFADWKTRRSFNPLHIPSLDKPAGEASTTTETPDTMTKTITEVKRTNGSSWTDAEDAVVVNRVKDVWPSQSIAELAMTMHREGVLPKRSLDSIKQRASLKTMLWRAANPKGAERAQALVDLVDKSPAPLPPIVAAEAPVIPVKAESKVVDDLDIAIPSADDLRRQYGINVARDLLGRFAKDAVKLLDGVILEYVTEHKVAYDMVRPRLEKAGYSVSERDEKGVFLVNL